MTEVQAQVPQVKYQFLLVLQDNLESGNLDIAGVQKPEEFKPNSPAHVVGRFIQNNLGLIINAARAEQMAANQVGALSGDVQLKLAKPKSELVEAADLAPPPVIYLPDLSRG